jgi:hypothetical protein
MEKLSDNDLLAISKDEWEASDMERNLAADLLSTRAELAACQKNLSDLCPIADMPVIESLKAEKLAMMEELAALQDKVRWVPVSERLPEAKQSVLVIVKRGQRHTEKACYIPPKTVLAEDFLSDEFDCEDAEEYDEENDCYWVVEGWWEDSWEADSNWKMSGEVTHWMPLPAQPEEG